MRSFLVALGLIALGSGALAADADYDIPVLRGSSPYIAAPPTYTGWGGLYGGGQIGYSRMGIDFGGGASSLVANIVRNSVLSDTVPNWTTLPKGDVDSYSVGGFIGYNQQWEDIILGWEVNYNHTSLEKSASDALARIISNDAGAPAGHHFFYDVGVSADGSVRITDLMTFRGRAAWVADALLPYAFGGLAVARADVVRSATVISFQTDVPDVTAPVTPPMAPVLFGPVSQADSKTGGFYFGYTAGIGVDYLVMPNMFLRGEWEMVHLPDVRGFRITVNTVRAGVGLKY